MNKKRLLAALSAAIGSMTSVSAAVKETKMDTVVVANKSDSRKKVQGQSKRSSNKKKSIKRYLIDKIKSDVLPNLDTPEDLKGEDRSIFLSMLSDNKKDTDGKTFKEFLSCEFMDGDNIKDDDTIDTVKISKWVLEKFEPIWRNAVVSDLQKTINGVVYGCDGSNFFSQGCCFSFGDPRENSSFFHRLGGKYFYDLTELVSFTGEKMSSKDIKEFKNNSDNTYYEQRILITVLSHLLISDFDVLKNKNNNEKSIVDCMRQIIMSRYMEKGYSLENIPGKLFYICYDIVDNAMKDYTIKLNVPWFETAKSCVAKNLFGAGRHWEGKIGEDFYMKSQNLISSPTFKFTEKLPDGTERNLKLKLVDFLDYVGDA